MDLDITGDHFLNILETYFKKALNTSYLISETKIKSEKINIKNEVYDSLTSFQSKKTNDAYHSSKGIDYYKA